MDMKKILAALDGVSERKPQGVDDMKRFVSIIKESTAPVEENVITGFEEGSVGGDANAFLIAADDINDLVMSQVDKIKINADEASLRDMMEKFNAFMTAYHNVGKGILQPDMFNDSLGEGLSFKDYVNLAEATGKQKGVDGKACWDGYKRMGTKKKGGKTVDNCVPTGKK